MKRYIAPPPAQWTAILRRPATPDPELESNVAAILAAVRSEGDAAVQRIEARFEGGKAPVRVALEELEAAAAEVPQALKDAIAVAQANITRFHAEQMRPEPVVETMPGVRCWRRNLPLDSVGLYIPGGSAPLFSTVLMLGIPARLAGCPRVALCTPAGADGRIHPAILYTAHLLGITEVYRIGGAQAIAALAYGTASIPAVDKVFGPGSRYVDMAKRLVAREGTAIDMPAGPSEVAVLADDTSDPAFVAADLLAQAEHGADSHVVLLCTSEAFADRVDAAVQTQLKELPRAGIAAAAVAQGCCIVMPDTRSALAVSDAYAPEHLILASADAEELATRVRHAGSVFVGPYSCESAGDYASGTNHTLPTDGQARYRAGVSVDSFVRKVTFQALSAAGLHDLGPAIVTMAEAEGLQAHARAVTIRTEA